MATKEEKIKIVKECYEKVKQIHGVYFPYLSNNRKALLIQDELPKRPIYNTISILMYLSGHFKVKKKYEKLIEDAKKEVENLPNKYPTKKFIAFSIQERLPVVPIYSINTIIYIISGQYSPNNGNR